MRRVAGLGVSGFAAADGAARGWARRSPSSTARRRRRAASAPRCWRSLGADVRLGAEAADAAAARRRGPRGHVARLAAAIAPLLAAAAGAGVPVWGEVELAWRLRPAEDAGAVAGLTGTNGKTTTVAMLESMLPRPGARAIAAGNVGLPLVDAVLGRASRYDVLAVELSSFQLHCTHSMARWRPRCSTSPRTTSTGTARSTAYAADKGRIYERHQGRLRLQRRRPRDRASWSREADVEEGCRAIGFTLGVPVGRHARRRRRTCWSTGPSSPNRARRPPRSSAPSPT